MKKLFVCFIPALVLILGCAGTPSKSAPDDLNQILREVSDYLNENIPSGRKVAFVSIQSESTALTEYIIDILAANAVNDRVFSVVDRQQLDAARAELNFNWSGEVSDRTAQSVGEMVGAQTIVTGRVSQIGERYHLNIRALETETVQMQGSNNWNIAAGATITALMRAGGGSGATTQTAARTAAGSTTVTGSGTASSGTSSAAGSATVQQEAQIVVPEGTTLINVNSAATWNAAINRIRNGGNNQTYIVNVTGNLSVPVPPAGEYLFGSLTDISVTFLGGGTISPSSNANLFCINTGQRIIAGGNLTLRGRTELNRNHAVVWIGKEAYFRLEGNASVTGNTGGGVRVAGGTFEMLGGTISDNTNASGGGGVSVGTDGIFTMKGGTISGNTARDHGGGVYLENGAAVLRRKGGTFIMEGGIISGNNSSRDGGGVYAGNNMSEFTKTGGTIYGSDASFSNRNTASGQGHAVYSADKYEYRNATAGPDDRTDGFGFYLND